jgi:hypothetical protein
VLTSGRRCLPSSPLPLCSLTSPLQQQPSLPSGKQIYQFRVTVKDLLDSCEENLSDPALRLTASHVLLAKLAKALADHPFANGSLFNGSFYRSPSSSSSQSPQVDISLLLKPSAATLATAVGTEEVVKLTHVSSKSIGQLASEMTQLQRQGQGQGQGKRWTVRQTLALGWHRILCTLFPEVHQHAPPLPHSNSPYGAALVLAFGEESSERGGTGAGTGMLFLSESSERSTVAIAPPLTVCLSNVTFSQRTLARNPTVHISLVIESGVMSLPEGAAFAHRLGRSLQKRD